GGNKSCSPSKLTALPFTITVLILNDRAPAGVVCPNLAISSSSGTTVCFTVSRPSGGSVISFGSWPPRPLTIRLPPSPSCPPQFSGSFNAAFNCSITSTGAGGGGGSPEIRFRSKPTEKSHQKIENVAFPFTCSGLGPDNSPSTFTMNKFVDPCLSC